ncbi:hypothetical protein GCM10007047_04930 [Cerasicoccus arenae]|uniref:Uncharacterized protein n=1 Tax=Cerasicoccus arenae TaxID=424488 RepID=A0A8J3GCX6_9BACT|nr:hypothetical protein GCM10007047_04930 [Cerasicoccus arenae]
MKLAKDQLSPGQGPTVFPREQLKASQRHLRDGNCLIVAMDMPSEAMREASWGGRAIRLSTGAVRMAVSTRSLVAACIVVETAPWRFEVQIGQPVCAYSQGLEAAFDQVAQDLEHRLRPYSEQSCWEVYNCLV